MLARAVVLQSEDGVTVDYVKADVARAPKRNWLGRFTPTQEIGFRDGLWKRLADNGATPEEIAIACARAARSPRSIRRRLRELEEQDRRLGSEAS